MAAKEELLRAHLDMAWLRPESALWDAVASSIVSEHRIEAPSLDLGCGNGFFSFITAGGRFSADYDWYVDAETGGFWKNRDIYDTHGGGVAAHVVKKPGYKFTYGLDHKPNLLEKAAQLGLYEKTIVHDANERLPFGDGELRTVFSNIIYWLDSPEKSLSEINRVLEKGGNALVCVPSTKLTEYCFSYGWKEEKNGDMRLLREKLNRGRMDDLRWTVSQGDFEALARKAGFGVVGHRHYISRMAAMFWDVGLRPVSPQLIGMANRLPAEDRKAAKTEWVENLYGLLLPLYRMETANMGDGVFHFFALEKK